MKWNIKITDDQVRTVCQELLSINRHVTIRNVQRALKARHGAQGQNSRIGSILKEARDTTPFSGMHNQADVNLHPNMRMFEFAVIVYIKQAGTDASDAYDRLEHNLSIRPGNSVLKKYPVKIAEGGPAIFTKPSMCVMSKEVK